MHYFLMFIFGAIIGSFLNCLLWRLHTGESMNGRSHCPKCREGISWYDNLPIISFLILRGKCRHCHDKISWQYPIVELIVGLLFTFLIYLRLPLVNFDFLSLADFFKQNYYFLLIVLRDCFLISVMVVIFIYDLRWYLILDRITIPSIFLLFGLNFLLGNNWQNLLISVIIGMSFFLLQFIISRGRWIGGGDIRLGALMGASLGWPLVLLAIFIAYFVGSIVGIAMILLGQKKWSSEIPFGIFLSTATIICLFWGNNLLNWYLALIKI